MSSTLKLLGTALVATLFTASCVFGGGGDDEAEATSTPESNGANGEPTADVDSTTPAGDDNGADEDRTPGADNDEGDAPGTYTVQEGDRLSDIAEQFGVTVEALAEANDIADPDLIFPGQELVIPSGSEGE